MAKKQNAPTRINDPSKLISRAIENAQDNFFILDMDGHVAYINHYALSKFKYGSREKNDLHLDKILFNSQLAKTLLKETLKNGMWTGEVLCITKKQKKFLTLLSMFLIKDSQDNPLGIMAIFQEGFQIRWIKESLQKKTTALSQPLKALVEDGKIFELRYHCFFETAKDGLLIADPDTGTIIDCNTYATLLLGYTKEDIIGKPIWKIASTKNEALIKTFFETVLKTGYGRIDNIPVQTKDGRCINIEFMSTISTLNRTKVLQCDLQDITARIASENSLKESEVKFKTLFEESRDGLLVADIETKRFIMWNRAICHMLGYTEDEIQRLRVHDLHPKEALPAILKLFERQAKGEIKVAETIPMKKKDGTIFYTDLLSSIFILKGKKYLVGSFRDVTEQKQLAETKNNFMNMVSHELRTPLSIIKEAFALALDGSIGTLNKQQTEVMTIAKNNIDRLARLIHQVLHIQRFETGKMGYSFEKTSINPLVKEVYTTVLPLAGKKGLSLITQLDETLPPVPMDKDKIIQVLINLVYNAVQFTEKGSIVIKTGQEANAIKVSVQDTGRGIQKQDAAKLFHQFTQIDPQSGGTGLGLAISKEIISAHKGQIWMESTFGKGTTFHFVLPMKKKEKAHDKNNTPC